MPPRKTIDADLTPRERACFAALARWLIRGDRPPSIREAAVLLGVSKSRAHELMRLYEQKGLIARVRKLPESTGVTHKGKRLLAEVEGETGNEQATVLEHGQ